MIEFIPQPILIAFFTAFVNTMLGYFRNTPPEEFDVGKFVATLLIAISVGFITVYMGWTYEEATEWLAQAGLTIWLYWIAAIIVKRFPKTS